MSLAETKATTTSSELVRHMTWLDLQEKEGRPAIFWYLAQIAAEIRRSYVAHPERVTLSQLLIDFTPPKPKVLSEKELADITVRAKQAHFARLGLDPQGRHNNVS